MGAGFFITGTDTGCGKTEVTLGLMQRLQQQGHRVLGMKPVASGGERLDGRLSNEDARRIYAQASIEIPYVEVNPYVFEPPIAPHLAARMAGQAIDLEHIAGVYERLQEQADLVLVEGVGGWHVPLGETTTVADLVLRLQLPVVLVVGMRLGCINHALLSAESLLHAGVSFAGWVANRIDPDMQAYAENLETLQSWLPAPCLGEIPHLCNPDPHQVAQCLGELSVSGEGRESGALKDPVSGSS
ncbi:MAG: dethiobiotin synthase [Candidatus Thiodiazotropha sp.]